MVKNKYQKRKDANQKQIEKELSNLKIEFIDVSRFGDMGYDLQIHYNTYIFCVEIKNPEYVNTDNLLASLTKNEKKTRDLCLRTNTSYIITFDTEFLLFGIQQWFTKVGLDKFAKNMYAVLQKHHQVNKIEEVLQEQGVDTSNIISLEDLAKGDSDGT